MTLQQKVEGSIRNIPDFPKKGIQFKDITTLLLKPELVNELVEHWVSEYSNKNIDVVVGLESRGFLFGVSIAAGLDVPFVPIRKAGKLPYKTVGCSYDLEYGSAEVEIHADALKPGNRVLIHDDLLATGGTARAAYDLCRKCDATVVGFSFLLELSDLGGRSKIEDTGAEISSIVSY